MKSNHNVMQRIKKPKRNLTGEAAIVILCGDEIDPIREFQRIEEEGEVFCAHNFFMS